MRHAILSSHSIYRTAAVISVRVAMPIFIGATMYLAWRTPTLLLFHWVDRVGLIESVMRLRAWMQPFRGVLPDLLVFSLPNALWAYAVTAFNAELWRSKPASVGKIFWCAARCQWAIHRHGVSTIHGRRRSRHGGEPLHKSIFQLKACRLECPSASGWTGLLSSHHQARREYGRLDD